MNLGGFKTYFYINQQIKTLINMERDTNYSQTPKHPIESIKDEWVLNRKSIHAGGVIVDHHIETPDTVEAGTIEHHLIGYGLSDLTPRQVTRMDGKEYDGELRKGDLWLKPNNTHSFWHWESTDECLLFAVEPAFLSKVAVQNDCANSSKIEVVPVIKTRDPILDALAIQFHREMERSELGNVMYVESLANQLAIHLLREYCAFSATPKEYKGGLAPYKLRQIINYINDNLDKRISLDDMAELLDLSSYYLCREFHNSVGVSPYRYIIDRRIEKAQELIKNTKLSLADVAYESGFSSQSQMTQHFRKSVGVTPKVYRDRL